VVVLDLVPLDLAVKYHLLGLHNLLRLSHILSQQSLRITEWNVSTADACTQWRKILSCVVRTIKDTLEVLHQVCLAGVAVFSKGNNLRDARLPSICQIQNTADLSQNCRRRAS